MSFRSSRQFSSNPGGGYDDYYGSRSHSPHYQRPAVYQKTDPFVRDPGPTSPYVGRDYGGPRGGQQYYPDTYLGPSYRYPQSSGRSYRGSEPMYRGQGRDVDRDYRGTYSSSTPYYNKYSRASSADVGFQYSEELNHAPSYSQNAFQAVARHSSYDTYGSGTPRPLAYGTRAYAAGLQDSRGSAMGSASGYIQYGSGNAAKNSAQTGAYAVSETHAGTPRSGKAAMYVPDTYTVTGYQGATEYQGQGSYKMSTGAADGQGSLQTPTYMPEGMTMAADYGFRKSDSQASTSNSGPYQVPMQQSSSYNNLNSAQQFTSTYAAISNMDPMEMYTPQSLMGLASSSMTPQSFQVMQPIDFSADASLLLPTYQPNSGTETAQAYTAFPQTYSNTESFAAAMPVFGDADPCADVGYADVGYVELGNFPQPMAPPVTPLPGQAPPDAGQMPSGQYSPPPTSPPLHLQPITMSPGGQLPWADSQAGESPSATVRKLQPGLMQLDGLDSDVDLDSMPTDEEGDTGDDRGLSESDGDAVLSPAMSDDNCTPRESLRSMQANALTTPNGEPQVEYPCPRKRRSRRDEAKETLRRAQHKKNASKRESSEALNAKRAALIQVIERQRSVGSPSGPLKSAGALPDADLSPWAGGAQSYTQTRGHPPPPAPTLAPAPATAPALASSVPSQVPGMSPPITTPALETSNAHNMFDDTVSPSTAAAHAMGVQVTAPNTLQLAHIQGSTKPPVSQQTPPAPSPTTHPAPVPNALPSPAKPPGAGVDHSVSLSVPVARCLPATSTDDFAAIPPEVVPLLHHMAGMKFPKVIFPVKRSRPPFRRPSYQSLNKPRSPYFAPSDHAKKGPEEKSPPSPASPTPTPEAHSPPVFAKLPFSPFAGKVVERFGAPKFKCSVSSMCGMRPSMEDAHSIYLANGIGVFGVFDGHAGRQCSQFVAQEFPEMVARCNTAQLSPQVLEHICLELDENWIITQNDDSGSTAAFVVAVPRPQDYQLWCGNIGDARVLLGRGTQLLHATTDHKPTMPVEVARIQNCGGWVDFGSGRVDGMLAVSRAFGDRRFKAGGPVQLQQKVIAQPSIARYEAAPGDFVVVACDGIFEKGFCNEEVVEFVGTALARNPDSAIACSALCEEALRRGSGDNMTAMIVQLQDGSGHQGQDFLPPPYIIGNTNSTSGFEGFCREAGFTVAQALEVRKNLVQEQNQPHFRHVYPPEIQIGMERELGFFGSNCPGNDTPAAQRQLFYERLAAFYEELKHNSENPQLPDPRDEIPTTQVEQPTEPRPEPLQKRTFSGSNMGIQRTDAPSKGQATFAANEGVSGTKPPANSGPELKSSDAMSPSRSPTSPMPGLGARCHPDSSSYVPRIIMAPPLKGVYDL